MAHFRYKGSNFAISNSTNSNPAEVEDFESEDFEYEMDEVAEAYGEYLAEELFEDEQWLEGIVAARDALEELGL